MSTHLGSGREGYLPPVVVWAATLSLLLPCSVSATASRVIERVRKTVIVLDSEAKFL